MERAGTMSKVCGGGSVGGGGEGLVAVVIVREEVR